MSRIFAYIAHKGGVADDSALELIAAAKKIDASCISDCDCHRIRQRARRGLRLSASQLQRSVEDRERGARLSQRRSWFARRW